MINFEDIKKANETIKTTDIKGKEYAEVNQRIKAFRMVYPDGFIETEMLLNENGFCIFKASVGINALNFDNELKNECRVGYKQVILGTGTAYEKENSSFINKTSYIENCETSAVGRALGMAGFGIDTSVASAEEIQNAIEQQEDLKPINEGNLKILQDLIKSLSDATHFYNFVLEKYQIKDLKELNKKQYGEILIQIKNIKGE